jgi:hypothetical protein
MSPAARRARQAGTAGRRRTFVAFDNVGHDSHAARHPNAWRAAVQPFLPPGSRRPDPSTAFSMVWKTFFHGMEKLPDNVP